MKTELDDKQLGAYADGELSPSESTAVKQAMLRDPRLRQRAEEIRRSTTQLRDAFDVVLNEPVPDKILRTFSSQRAAAHSLPTERPTAVSIAVAASIALVIGSLGGFWMGQVDESTASSNAWMATLHVDSSGLLETTPSGAPVPWHSRFGEMELQPVLSFRDKSGRICRQYALTDTNAAGDHVDGVACRSASGAWRVQLASVRNGDAPGGSMGFSVAEGPATAPINSLVDALASDAISPEEERDLIRARWR